MDPTIRSARRDEAATLSELALRSKGFWGYDASFLEACRDELAVRDDQVLANHVTVAELLGNLIGFYGLGDLPDARAELRWLFVDPESIGHGVGTGLLEHAIRTARAAKFRSIVIASDPFAEGFYLGQGACRIGEVPSGSIKGRQLPLLELSVNDS